MRANTRLSIHRAITEATSALLLAAGLMMVTEIAFRTWPCLVMVKSVTNLTRSGTTAELGDTLRYTVMTNNGGGNPALQSVSSDVLASGIDFAPGSIKVISGPGTGNLTDATGDDRGSFTSGNRTVQVRFGDGGTATPVDPSASARAPATPSTPR